MISHRSGEIDAAARALTHVGREPEQRRVEGDAGDVAAHPRGRTLVALAVGQRAAPDPVIGEVLERQHVALGVEAVQVRDELGGERAVLGVRACLGDRALAA